ncbi:MAG: hypothetical protein IPK50_04715 [Fibrobacterota bacterium]|nr:hypothetical protein [Fibrobacterota bacterium]QQS06196.1 MAG: hypothetical protein IPK50_04715 [Fibrobacterota bacterium]
MDKTSRTLLLLVTASLAQMTGPNVPAFSNGTFPTLGRGSEQPVLTDPKRMQVHQSVTFSAGSGGGSTYSQGLYNNEITYRLSDPLTLQLNLGVLTPFSASGPAAQGMQKGAYLIPDIGLEYRPSESVLFSVKYMSIPAAPVGQSGGLPWQ